MAIKDLAVAYNASENSDAALQYAVQMCNAYGAALTGLHAHLPVKFEGQIEHWLSDDVLKSLSEAASEGIRAIEARFRKTVASTDFTGAVDWIVEEGQPNDILARAARYYDLLLIGQFSVPTEKERRVRAEDLVLRAGKPVVVVPNGYRVRPFTDYAVVAWDGSRAAARALADAMQILETKTRLDVVTVRAGGKAGRDAAPASNDIIRHLERHGVDAQRVTLTAHRGEEGEAILEHCRSNDPDLLVMGGYGHTRLREELLGGVTRHVMRNMAVPIFMVH